MATVAMQEDVAGGDNLAACCAFTRCCDAAATGGFAGFHLQTMVSSGMVTRHLLLFLVRRRTHTCFALPSHSRCRTCACLCKRWLGVALRA